MTDLTNALNAGHEVTISQSQINFKGWTGSGYIIIDPNNGSGAYLISGGANGAVAFFLGFLVGQLISMLVLGIESGAVRSVLTTPATFGGAFFGILIISLVIYSFIRIILKYDDERQTNAKCLAKGLITGGAVRTIIGASIARKILSSMSLSLSIGFLSSECQP